MNGAVNLDVLRQQIDQLDQQIIVLLAERLAIVKAIADCKARVEDIQAYERLLPMLAARKVMAEAHQLDGDFVARLFEQIAQHAMTLQRERMAAGGKQPQPSEKPTVYSCSGCSSAAQLANDVAVSLDREGMATMSCIAGVGGDVKSLVRKATAGKPILAIDGCALACVRKSLQRHGVKPDAHVVLSELGVGKRQHQSYTSEESLRVRAQLIPVVQQLASTHGT